jgi:hypothetical protein
VEEVGSHATGGTMGHRNEFLASMLADFLGTIVQTNVQE